MSSHQIYKILLFAICLPLISACKTLEIGFERTPPATLSTSAAPKRAPAISPLATSVSTLTIPTSPSSTPLLQPSAAPSLTSTTAPATPPLPTLLPTLALEQLLPEVVAKMSVWRKVENESPFDLYQISEAPNGVTSVEWAPNGQNMWLNAATGPGGWGNYADTVPLVINHETHMGWNPTWNPAEQGDWVGCYRTHDWTPSGELIAYHRYGRVWLAAAEGQNRHALPIPEGWSDVNQPQFSPNGQYLAVSAYLSGQGYARSGVAVYAVTSEAVAYVIETGKNPRLAWSPQGDTISILHPNQDNHALLTFLNVTTGLTVTTDLGEFVASEGCLPTPLWVQSGQRVLVGSTFLRGLWLVDRDGQSEPLLPYQTSDPTRKAPGLAAPYFGGPCNSAIPSPDGRYAAYSTGNNRLYVRDFETNQDVAFGQGSLCYGQTKIKWSPTQPQFIRWGDVPTFEVINASDGAVRKLPPRGEEPAWSPDGRRIAYWVSSAEGVALELYELEEERVLYLLAPSQHDLSSQTGPYVYDRTPQWSPDGHSIAFVSWREDLPEAYVLQLP